MEVLGSRVVCHVLSIQFVVRVCVMETVCGWVGGCWLCVPSRPCIMCIGEGVTSWGLGSVNLASVCSFRMVLVGLTEWFEVYPSAHPTTSLRRGIICASNKCC